jgi:AcrR family transcriptional regulator
MRLLSPGGRTSTATSADYGETAWNGVGSLNDRRTHPASDPPTGTLYGMSSARRPEKQRELVRAALQIADRDGLEAVSMRRVSAELGWGTMTLYSYVANKDELVGLMADELGGELLVPAPLPADWREAMTAIARRTRQLLLAHPWVMSAPRGTLMSAAFARHVEQTFAALAHVGVGGGGEVDVRLQRSIARAVDDYTIGATRGEINERRNGPAALERKRAHLTRLLESEDLPHLARAFAVGALDGGPSEREFELGLDWLLSGIAASLAG